LSTRSVRGLALLGAFAVAGSTGCWEQWSNGWFPQMKWQPAVQPYEALELDGRDEGFTPPEGAIPVGGGEAPVSNVIDAAADVLVNPTDTTDFRSLQNGQVQYERFCSTCHGATGLADGPVAPVFQGVLPLVGVVKARSDGHIYVTIRHGRRRMPAYGYRIPAQDRWDIVNYVRFLDAKGGRP
jgi:mono/diheme cytochrome c family protein